MVNFPKMAHLHGNFTKKNIVSREIFRYGNISVALIINTHAFTKPLFPCFGHNYTAGS
jgi:tetrahydromethanopterin S-methyltransferase subunit C